MSKVRAAIDWGNVVARTAGWGTLSVTVGAVTPGNRFSQWCMHQWCVGTSRGLRMDRELFHGERLDQVPQCVYVANHLSLLDILLIGSFLDRDYRWLAKEQIFQVPFLGWHLTLAGHVRVHRKDTSRNRELPERIHQVVEEGGSPLFFPEGTRSHDGHLKPFKIGAFMTAVTEGLPVVPLVVRGTDQLMRKGAPGMSVAREAPRKVSVTVLPALHALPDGDLKERAEDLKTRAEAAFRAELYGAAEEPATEEPRSAAR
jgi:1-acyl-sn-glycerol-3-phosphate acyltransferase